MEKLETRRLLATFVVDRTDDVVDQDPGDGICEVSGGGCTLRAAIQEANAVPNVGGADVVRVPAGQFTLSREGMDEDQAITGDLDITEGLTLVGHGAQNTIIDAASIDRVFDINRGVVVFRDVAIQGGSIIDDELSVEASGGGIRNEGDLTLIDTVVSGNTAPIGAGVANYLGTLQVVRSVISGNGDFATQRGGGIANESNYDPASVQLIDSTISGNRAVSGGGVSNYSYDGAATATIVRSTISGNTADEGGGIANQSVYGYEPDVRAMLMTRNSTLSGNVATNVGGGIANRGNVGSEAAVIVENTTVANNSATSAGGGIHQIDDEGTTTTLTSTIVAGNQAGAGRDVFSAVATGSFSLIQDPDGHSLVDGESGNIIGLNAVLGPLQNNGGVTQTHLPDSISPVVDRGTNASQLDRDQRGAAFRRTVDLPLNGNAADGTDIGSVEIGQEGAELDFGDAPESQLVGTSIRRYPTTLDQDGARHRIIEGGPRLGVVTPDGEFDAQSNASATGDDLSERGDEDAIADPIVLTPGEPMAGTIIRYDAGDSGANLSGWIDFNLDGDWDDPGEQILSDVSVPAGPGSLSLEDVLVPPTAVSGRTFLRLRISTDVGLTTQGQASDGEVEDFMGTIGEPLPDVADLSLTQSVDQVNPTLGQQIQFTITVRNQGPDRATGVEVGTFLPFELSFVDSTVSQGRYDSLDEVWDVGALSSGAVAVLRVTVQVDSTDPISHTAEIIASDQDDPNSTPDNGIEAEDDQQTVSVGTCLAREAIGGGSSGLTYTCGSRAGAFVAFVRGTERGMTSFDSYNVTVDMADADVFATAIVGADGAARVPLLVGPQDVGETFLVQAFEIGPEQGKSNTLVIDVDEDDLASPQTNLANPADVNADGTVTALDALIVINRLALGEPAGEPLAGARIGDPSIAFVFPDTNRDGRITAADALFVINRLAVDPTKIRR